MPSKTLCSLAPLKIFQISNVPVQFPLRFIVHLKTFSIENIRIYFSKLNFNSNFCIAAMILVKFTLPKMREE